MKYAFKGDTGGAIRVSTSLADGLLTIVYGVDLEHSTGFGLQLVGLQLVGLLAQQIGGAIRIDRSSRAKYILEL